MIAALLTMSVATTCANRRSNANKSVANVKNAGAVSATRTRQAHPALTDLVFAVMANA